MRLTEAGQRFSSLQETLAALGAGHPGWTVLYAAYAAGLANDRVVFLPVRAPGGRGAGLSLPTVLAVRHDVPSTLLGPLLDACRAVAAGDHDS